MARATVMIQAKALRGKRFDIVRPRAETEVALRCLDDCDAALGVDGGAA